MVNVWNMWNMYWKIIQPDFDYNEPWIIYSWNTQSKGLPFGTDGGLYTSVLVFVLQKKMK